MHKLIQGLWLGLLTCALPLLALAGPVNVNTADAETIASELSGVGMSKAQAIVAYRELHGPFKTLDDLTLVRGIGEKTVEANRENILLETVASQD